MHLRVEVCAGFRAPERNIEVQIVLDGHSDRQVRVLRLAGFQLLREALLGKLHRLLMPFLRDTLHVLKPQGEPDMQERRLPPDDCLHDQPALGCELFHGLVGMHALVRRSTEASSCHARRSARPNQSWAPHMFLPWHRPRDTHAPTCVAFAHHLRKSVEGCREVGMQHPTTAKDRQFRRRT